MGRGQFQQRQRADGTVEFGYQYTDPTDRRRKWFWGTLAAVSAFKQKIERARVELRHDITTRAAVRASLPGHADPHHIRLADVFERYLLTLPPRARAVARSTFDHNIDVGGLGRMVAMDLTPEVMSRWAVELQSTGGREGLGRAPKTIMNALAYLTAALRKILGLEKLPWGRWKPFRSTKVEPRRPRAAVRSFEELVAIVTEARRRDARLWASGKYADCAFAIVVAALTGMRNAELAGLGWDDVRIDYEPYTLTVRYQAPRGWRKDAPKQQRPTVPPKNGHTHFQVLHYSVRVALLEQRAQLERLGWYREDGPVFPSKHERAYSGRWRTSGRALDPRRVRRIVEAAGVPNAHRWCVHSFRHSKASLEALAHGGDLKTVAAITGHHDLGQLQTYLHQMGVGAPRSALPRLPDAMVRAAIDAPSDTEPAPPPSFAAPALLAPRPAIPDTDPWALAPEPGDLALAHAANIEAAEREERARRRRERAESERPFDELAREWLDQVACAPGGKVRDDRGRPIPRPHAVTLAARRKYCAGYQRGKYAGKSVEECRRLGRRGENAVLAVWARVLRQEETRRRATGPVHVRAEMPPPAFQTETG